MPNVPLAAERAARKYGISPALLKALINQESGGNPNARSPAGAQGVAQFMPATAKAYDVNLNDGRVTDDLEGAARYLRDNLKRTGGNVSQALSIYNSGSPTGYKRIAETSNYVKTILAHARANGGSVSGTSSPQAVSAPSSTTTAKYTPGTATFEPDTTSNGAGLSDLIAAQLSGQEQQAAPAAMLQDPSFSASKYVVGAALPQASGAMVQPKLDVGAALDALESSAPVSDIQTTPGKLTTSTKVDPVGLPVPSSGSSKGASAAVDFAKSRLGQYAENTGSNRGLQLDTLEQRFGMKGQPWCAIFTSVAVTRGGAPKSARTASVATIRQQVDQGGGGYQHGFVAKPKPGDLMLFGNAHVGLVESVNRDGTVTTVEGNTSAGKVQRVKRAANSGDFARPKYK